MNNFNCAVGQAVAA